MPASAPCSTTAADSAPSAVEPQPSLMFRPSGSSPMVMTSAPARRSACGAIRYAAPCAQSATTRRPASGGCGCSGSVASRWSRYSSCTARTPGVPWSFRRPRSTAAAATLRFKTRYAVRSPPATPKTPSVPNKRLRCPASAISLRSLLCWCALASSRPAPRGRHLPLGVLRRLAGLLQAVLLALLDPGVPGQEAGLLQRRAVLRIHQGQCPGHAEAQRARLPGDAAAGDPGHDVELVLRAQGHERLVDELLVHLVREV